MHVSLRHVVLAKGLPHVMALSFPQREVDEWSTKNRSTQDRSHSCSIANLGSYSPLLLLFTIRSEAIQSTLKGWRLQNLWMSVFFSEAVYPHMAYIIWTPATQFSSFMPCWVSIHTRFQTNQTYFSSWNVPYSLASRTSLLHLANSPVPCRFQLASIIYSGSISWLFFLSYPIRIRTLEPSSVLSCIRL